MSFSQQTHFILMLDTELWLKNPEVADCGLVRVKARDNFCYDDYCPGLLFWPCHPAQRIPSIGSPFKSHSNAAWLTLTLRSLLLKLLSDHAVSSHINSTSSSSIYWLLVFLLVSLLLWLILKTKSLRGHYRNTPKPFCMCYLFIGEP